jgi:ADP-heptose:LPS heptosyltransferase
MEALKVAQHIEKIIVEIGKARRLIEEKGQARARAISDYDKQLRVAIITLKESGKFPATLIEKIAKGVCSPQIEAREIAESGYKAVISNLQALMAQLNGYQSIYRHLDET